MHHVASDRLKALDQKRYGEAAPADLVVQVSLGFLNAN
jgi:hypothetical protein